MAEESVKVDLQSSADTTGFDKFEASYNSLRAAKEENIRANGLFSDSERRIRANVDELVTGLAGAHDATEAVSVAVNHLSEVFELGFSGTIIAGLAATFIEQFSKVTQEIDKTDASIKKTGEDIDDLERQVQGVKLTPAEERAGKITKVGEQLRTERAEAESTGIFKMIRLGFSNLFGGSLGEDIRKQETELNRRQLQVFTLAGKNAAEGEEAKLGQILSPTPRGKVENVAFEQLVREQEDQQELAARAKKLQEDRDAQAKRAAMEAAKDAERAAAERDRAAAAADREAEKEEPRRTNRIQAHIYAGAQRAVGGGGGVYSTIVRDPVVEESRKHTTLLTEIANSVKILKSPAPTISAALV